LTEVLNLRTVGNGKEFRWHLCDAGESITSTANCEVREPSGADDEKEGYNAVDVPPGAVTRPHHGVILPLYEKIEQDDDDDAVDSEEDEGMVLDVSEQKPDAQERGAKGNHETDREILELVRGKGPHIFRKVKPGGSQHCRDGEEKGELHDGSPAHPEDQSTHNGCGRPRHSGNHGNGLKKTDKEACGIRYIFQLFSGRSLFRIQQLEDDEEYSPRKRDQRMSPSLAKKTFLMILYRARPMMAVGIKAVMTLFRTSRFIDSVFQYRTTTERIAPNWMEISKVF
jgi:hypothetical protein